MSDNQPSSKTPISAHRLFPVMVALWFAALLGLGTLVLPAALLENVFGITGLIGRVMLAAAAAVIGAVSGLLLARKVAGAQGSTVYADHEPEYVSPVKTPISALEELGSEGLDEPITESNMPSALIRGRRRALTATDNVEEAEFEDVTPQPFDLADMEEPADEDEALLELSEFATSEEFENIVPATDAWEEEPENEPGYHDPEEPVSFEEPTLDQPEPDYAFLRKHEEDTGVPHAFDEPTPSAPFDAPVAPVADEPADEPEEDARQFDAPVFSAPVEPAASGEIEAAPASVYYDDEPVHDAAEQPAPVKASPQTAAELLTSKPLGELGMVELVERFALSLQSAEPASFHMPEDEHVEEFLPQVTEEPVAAQVDEPVKPATFGPTAIPAALRPINLDTDFDDDYDDDDSEEPGEDFAFAAPQHSGLFSKPADAVVQANLDGEHGDGEDEDEWDDSAENYSSLLAMRTAFNAPLETAKADDSEDENGAEATADEYLEDVAFETEAEPEPEPEPVVAFPSPDQRRTTPEAPDTPLRKRANTAETERALRDALEKLQKMSGAA